MKLRLEALDEQISARLDRLRRARRSATTIPPHNPRFVGRAGELRQLRESLLRGHIGAITAVHGIGGIGKSALAFEYAHGFADDYPGGRYLLPCGGAADLRAPMIQLGAQLAIEFSPAEQQDPDRALARVLAALQQRERTLLLLDNVDDAGLLAPEQRARCLPAGEHVHVLATTRLEAARLPDVSCVPLDALSDQEAQRLLEQHRPFADEEEWKAALGIVRRLGRHPLAVEVVAVFLWQNPEVLCRDYLARLEAEGLGALDAAGADELVQLSRHPEKTLGRLLEPTLAGLAPAELLALECASLLPPDTVPLPWLRELAAEQFAELGAAPAPGHPDPLGASGAPAFRPAAAGAERRALRSPHAPSAARRRSSTARAGPSGGSAGADPPPGPAPGRANAPVLGPRRRRLGSGALARSGPPNAAREVARRRLSRRLRRHATHAPGPAGDGSAVVAGRDGTTRKAGRVGAGECRLRARSFGQL